MDAEMQEAMQRRSKMKALTAREREVLLLLTTAATNKQIAHRLFISEKTVKCHVRNIFQKLNVTHRLQAILLHFGLIDNTEGAE